MNRRLKYIYLLVGRVLNNPIAFGLDERPPKALERALAKIHCELIKELREEISEEGFLATELSQDADRPALHAATGTGAAVDT
jgi:hypothetical protein